LLLFLRFLVGAVFDNAYHNFLANTIVANDAVSFAGNHDPFTDVFPDWFRDSLNETNQLDTDIALAFPSLDTTVHPHFDGYTNSFALSNAEFLNKFFAAMHKMGQLGVSATLYPATECEPRCGRAVVVGGDGPRGDGDGGGGELGRQCFAFWSN
jgi:hypothetical protein